MEYAEFWSSYTGRNKVTQALKPQFAYKKKRGNVHLAISTQLHNFLV